MIASRRQSQRRSRRASPSRAAASGARPAILAMTATSPRRRSTGARSPAITARAVAMPNGAVSLTSRRTRRLPVNNLLQGRRRGPRHHNRRTPKLSMEEWSCPTACLVGAALGIYKRAARPAPSLLMGGSVPCRTASLGSGRTAAGTAKMKARATSSNGTIVVLRRRSRPQSRRRTTS